MRRARSPLWQRPLTMSTAAVCLVVLLSASSDRFVQASSSTGRQMLQKNLAYAAQHDEPAPAATTDTPPQNLQQEPAAQANVPAAAGQQPAMAPVEVAAATMANPVTVADLGLASPNLAPAPAPADSAALPGLPGLAFLGLPPLPRIDLPHVIAAAPQPEPLAPLPAMAPLGAALAPAGALAPMDHGDASGQPAIAAAVAPAYDAAVTSFRAALAPYVAPLVAAAAGPTPTPEKILADFTAAIPDVASAPAPQPAINIRAPDGSKAASYKLPTAATIFSALEHLGGPAGRRLLQGPPDPSAGAESLRENQQDYTGGPLVTTDNGLTTTSFAAPVQTAPVQTAPVQTAPVQTLPAPGPVPVQASPSAEATPQATPGPQAAPLPLPQPVAFAPLAAPLPVADEAAPQLPAPGGPGALAPLGAVLPADAPLPQPVAPGPSLAAGPVPEELKVFTEKLANYVGFQVRKNLPARIDVLPGLGRRHLAENHHGPQQQPPPLLPEPFAAEAPLTAPGGLPQPGPIFQALPEPLPLPELPQPQSFMENSMMAPEAAPGALPQPGAQYQSHHQLKDVAPLGRKLQKAGGMPQPGPILQALPEPGPLPELPQPQSFMESPMMAPEAAPGALPLPQPGAQYQSHHQLKDVAPLGRKLQEAGGMPQPGPILQALPEPGPLPELPQPQSFMESPMMAPEAAPGALPQPGAQYQSHHQLKDVAPLGRKLQQAGADDMLEAIQPFDAGAPSADSLPQTGMDGMPEPVQPFAAEAPSADAGLPEAAAPAQAFAAAAPGLPTLPDIVTLPGPEGTSELGPTVSPAVIHPAAMQRAPGKLAFYNVTASRALLQAPEDGPPGTIPEPVQPFAAEAPLTAPGGLPQPGPIFQALPEPAPLPELPQPQSFLESPMMAPESAPGALPQPVAQLEAHRLRNQYFGITRKLQGLEAPVDALPGTVPEPTQPFAADAPLTAPGGLPQPGPTFEALPVPEPIHPIAFASEAPLTAPGGLPQPGPIFQALPEPLPLLELPQPQRPAEFMTESPMMAPEPQAGAQLQEHRLHSQYFGTFTRKLQGLEAPIDVHTVPEATRPFAAEAPLTAPGGLPQPGPIFAELLPLPEPMRPFAAEAPLTAPGGLPQPGPIFQALPEPLPLPELPQPQRPAEFITESPIMAPESAPGAEPQPGAQLQEHHLRSQYFGITRKLQQATSVDRNIPFGDLILDELLGLPIPIEPMAAEAPKGSALAPMTAPSGEPQPNWAMDMGRRLLQHPGGPHHPMPLLPPPLLPEPFAAEAPLTAPGGLPQPGPTFQDLPKPHSQPELPQPREPASFMEAPMPAPAGWAGPGAMLQAGHKHQQHALRRSLKEVSAFVEAPAHSAELPALPPLPAMGSAMAPQLHEPLVAQGPSAAFPAIPADVANGIANVFKSVVPTFLAQLAGR